MIGDPLVLSVDNPTAVATNQETLDKRYTQSGRSQYSEAGLTLPEESLCTISHEIGKGGEERHLVRFDRVVVDSENVPATVSVYMVAVRPPNTAATNAVCISALNKLMNFMSTVANANFVKVLNSEV